MKRYFIGLLISISFLIIYPNHKISAAQWREQKGDHFILRYDADISYDWARRVLSKAEEYYDSIALQIDYPRYNQFWTWDKRVEITIYLRQEEFLKETGQPIWSKGGAFHRPWLLEQRKIVTFFQEEGFLEGLLPHEISHLMLIDFIGKKQQIPIWFNEGVAQLQEQGRALKAHELMRQFVRQNRHIPLFQLVTQDIRHETVPVNVVIFYSQSLSVVDFMITKFGSERFGILCRAMRDGEDFEGALISAYRGDIDSLSQLEKRWLSYMKNG